MLDKNTHLIPTVFVPLLSSQSTLIVSVKILNTEDLNQQMDTEA